MASEVPAAPADSPRTMRAVRLHPPGGLDALRVEEIEIPRAGSSEALVRVHAAAITRDELDWPVDRLPAIPSYELSGIVVEVAPDATDTTVGEAVYALTAFDRDGAAAEYAVVEASLLASKPRSMVHAVSAAIPMTGLSAWQGLFVHGGLEAGQRVLIHGAAGGVGHVATQLARWRGAHVVGTASGAGVEIARALGAEEVFDRTTTAFEEVVELVDLVFDTVGGDALARSAAVLREGGRLVSVAEEPPADLAERVAATYFVVEPDREQLVELARLAEAGALRPAIDSTFELDHARAAFERVMASGKHGKVVLDVVHD
jgi:NADPH:quinone reductase-like Zn-dependent oxidoreductase